MSAAMKVARRTRHGTHRPQLRLGEPENQLPPSLPHERVAAAASIQPSGGSSCWMARMASPLVIHSKGLVMRTPMPSDDRRSLTRLNVSGWVDLVERAPPRLGRRGKLMPV